MLYFSKLRILFITLFSVLFILIALSNLFKFDDNFFDKKIPLCGVLGGGYNKDFKKLVELHAILHKSCASIL